MLSAHLINTGVGRAGVGGRVRGRELELCGERASASTACERAEKEGKRAARRLRDARAPEPAALSQPGRTCAGGRRGAPLPWGKGPDGRREPRGRGAEGGRTGGGLERESPALRFPGWAGARKEPRAAGVLGFPPGPCTRAHTTRLHSLGLRNGGSTVFPAQLRPGDAAGRLRPPPSSLSPRAPAGPARKASARSCCGRARRLLVPGWYQF